MSKQINIGCNSNGVPFIARLVTNGDKYGRKHCLVHEGKPVIEFYDARYPHDADVGVNGQFVSRYYVDTLTGADGFGSGKAAIEGLNLDGGVRDWFLNAEQVAKALELAQEAS